jgi:diadenosine tetraphosphate (Ap4A) HIT family hydrolase
MVIAEMDAGYAVMADMQFIPGWCILLPRHPAGSLNEMALGERSRFLTDMSVLGDAILAVCGTVLGDCPVRVNYDILGNADQYLHAHVYPRYSWEDPERLSLPVWLYPQTSWSDERTAYREERHGKLKAALREYLIGRGAK